MTRSLIRTVFLSLGIAACASTPEPAASPTPSPANPAPAPSAEAPPSTEASPIYDGNTTQAIKARAGQRFTVALPANITTPFKWVVANPNDAIAKLVANDYDDAPPPGCRGCVGYGGTTTLTFEAVAPGTIPLQLAYRGLNQADAPAQREVAIQLTVE